MYNLKPPGITIRIRFPNDCNYNATEVVAHYPKQSQCRTGYFQHSDMFPTRCYQIGFAAVLYLYACNLHHRLVCVTFWEEQVTGVVIQTLIHTGH